MNRVQHCKRIVSLIKHSDWDALASEYGYKPRFTENAAGDKFLDASCIPWTVWQYFSRGKNPTKVLAGLCILNPNPPKDSLPPLPPRRKKEIHPMRRCLDRVPVRERLYTAQNGICHYCGQPTIRKDWTIDHVLPISKGGTNAEENLRGACYACNNAKADMTEWEFRATQKGIR